MCIYIHIYVYISLFVEARTHLNAFKISVYSNFKINF